MNYNYEEYKEKLINYLNQIEGCFTAESFERLKNFMLKEDHPQGKSNVFLHAPASTRFHCNFDGGLMIHSVNVVDKLLMLTEKMGLTWVRPESPIIVGLLHDLCKTYNYEESERNVKEKNPITGKDEWVKKPVYVTHDIFPIGHHADKSLLMTMNLGIKLEAEEIACIRFHMGYAEGESVLVDYSNAKAKWVNCLWTNVADELATLEEPIIK